MRASGLDIVSAAVEDVAAVVGLVNRAYSPAKAADGWVGERSFQRGDRTSRDEVLSILASPDQILFLGYRGDRLVACCTLTHAGTAAKLGLFAVDPTEQGTGAGRDMIRYAEDFSRTRWRTSRLKIEVMEHHAPLIAWYERLGYEATGRRIPYADEASQPSAWLIEMAKRLDA